MIILETNMKTHNVLVVHRTMNINLSKQLVSIFFVLHTGLGYDFGCIEMTLRVLDFVALGETSLDCVMFVGMRAVFVFSAHVGNDTYFSKIVKLGVVFFSFTVENDGRNIIDGCRCATMMLFDVWQCWLSGIVLRSRKVPSTQRLSKRLFRRWPPKIFGYVDVQITNRWPATFAIRKRSSHKTQTIVVHCLALKSENLSFWHIPQTPIVD